MANFKPRLQAANIDLTSILEDINNLPPAGTEDISAELNEQTVAVEELKIMVSRKVAENNGAGAFVWSKLTAEGGDFVDFVVSSDEAAYPNGGTQDGYWYERVNVVEYTSGTTDISEGSALETNTFYFVTA